MDNDFPIQDLTIYHKADDGWTKYNVKGSYRNTSTLIHSRSGFYTNEKAVIRIFDVEGYNNEWFVSNNDVIVNMKVEDEITSNAPLTQLREKYGEDNVIKITSVSKSIYDDADLDEINHIRLGGK